MGVSKNTGTPKWMVKIMENPMNKWMIWGGWEKLSPLFLVQHPYVTVTVFDQHRGMANSKLTIYTDHGSSDEDVELINPEDVESDAAKGEPEARLAKIGRLWDG